MNHVLYDAEADRVLDPLHPFRAVNFVTDDPVYAAPAETDVSVVVPCYNAEAFLPACVESLMAQETKYAFEVILVNDGSKDRTGEIAEEAAKKSARFRCIHQENGGAAAARNRGMRAARGRYLLFVDADDVISPGYIENLTACAEEAGADLAVCAYYSFAGDGQRYKEVRWADGITPADLNGTPWGKLFRRALFSRLLWPVGYWYEDTVLAFLVYPRVRKLAWTNGCAYGYRSSMQNATHTGRRSAKALDTLYITALALEAAERAGLSGWLRSPDGQRRVLDQFYLNQCRIQNLPDAARREVFRLQSVWWRENYGQTAVSGGDSALYARALRQGDVRKALLAVKLEKAGKALKLLGGRLKR